MPIVLVCNADSQIVWISGNLPDTVRDHRAEIVGRDLFDFLRVPAGHPFRREAAALMDGRGHVYYAATLPATGGRERAIDFWVERVPSHRSFEGAALIAVGVDADGDSAAQTPETAAVTPADPLRRTYRYSNLRLEDGATLFARLEQLIDDEGLFRDQNFSLEAAAMRLGTNALYVSQATNFFSGMSFPIYLNHKRYRDLAALLAERPDEPFAVLWRAAGFGSYSSLNRFLRSQYEISPSAFVRRVRGGGF